MYDMSYVQTSLFSEKCPLDRLLPLKCLIYDYTINITAIMSGQLRNVYRVYICEYLYIAVYLW